PVMLTVRVTLCASNVEVTTAAPVTVTVQVPVPTQPPPPLQPLKVEPALGVAVRVTVVPLGKVAEQPVPQSMPAGVLVTVQLPVPAQPPLPLQPAKVEPALGAAVRVTVVPLG